MNQVLLFTNQNQKIKDYIKCLDADIKDVRFSMIDEYVYLLKNKDIKTFVLVEVNSTNYDTAEVIFDICNKHKAKIIALTDKFTCEIDAFLKKNGIASLLTFKDLKNIPESILLNLETTGINVENEKIVVCEENKSNIRIIKNISEYYNYETIIAKSEDEIFDIIQDNNCIILLNLGMKKFDISSFISKAQKIPEMKSTPFIPYKNKSNEICVEEIYSGLHKFARAILSPDELFSFLVNIFFRKELYSIVDNFENKISLKENLQYADLSLKKLYFTLGADIFTLKDLSIDENLDKYNSIIKSLQYNMKKITVFKWLMRFEKNAITCGLSGER